ncbi:MAG TPA: hypothetical protein VNK91_02065 [Burkholderiaceae bacterium]|nr:hypothetical protein [Burkholderiaceae bacterium]
MATITEQIIEIERELETRKRVYPKWVKDGRISPAEADRRVACLGSVLETLRLVRCLKEIG